MHDEIYNPFPITVGDQVTFFLNKRTDTGWEKEFHVGMIAKMNVKTAVVLYKNNQEVVVPVERISLD